MGEVNPGFVRDVDKLTGNGASGSYHRRAWLGNCREHWDEPAQQPAERDRRPDGIDHQRGLAESPEEE